MRAAVLSVGLAVAFLNTALAQTAPNTSPDMTDSRQDQSAVASKATFDSIVVEAQRTYPDAKRRFLTGLPKGQKFFVWGRVQDSNGKYEAVFIRVQSIAQGKIKGRIASDHPLFPDDGKGRHYSLAETNLVDWIIDKPDGSREGDLVGKLLGRQRP